MDFALGRIYISSILYAQYFQATLFNDDSEMD